MLRLLANLSPVIVLLLGAVPAATAGWFAHGAKFALVDAPAIAREAAQRADDACAIRVQAAADRAEDAERNRQKAAGAEALRIYQEALARSELAIELQSRQMSDDIARYEAQLEAQGRTCPLSRDDLNFVFGPGGAGR
jgi:parvulin-like peptidyl-prolyl isomerase